MAEPVIDITSIVLDKIGYVSNWIKALGVIVVVWLIFQIITFILQGKRNRQIRHLRENVERLEKKIDKLLKKNK